MMLDISYYEHDPQQLLLISFYIFLFHFLPFFKKENQYWGQFLDVSYVFTRSSNNKCTTVMLPLAMFVKIFVQSIEKHVVTHLVTLFSLYICLFFVFN